MDYSNPEVDMLSTGEIKLNTEGKNFFGVYESFPSEKKFETIIIDEAHFISDDDRGVMLQDLINKLDCNIYMVTATQNFSIDGFKNIHLKAIESFEKEEISSSEFWERVEAGEPSIIFRDRKDDCGMAGGEPIHADIDLYNRLRIQRGFRDGKINLIETTNVLAQGLNFPATNIYIEESIWNTPELIKQKLGRLGRPFITSKDDRLTYHIEESIEKINKKQVEGLARRKVKNFKRFINECGNFIYEFDLDFDISNKENKRKLFEEFENGVSQKFLTKNNLTIDDLQLIDCKDCWNCAYCFKCHGCENCKRCIKCYVCLDCQDCVECYYSLNCKSCFYCENCSKCIECYNCKNCWNCKKCVNCENCENCKNFYDGYYLVKNKPKYK